MLRILSVLAGVAVGVCAELFLKGTGIYGSAMMAAGALITLPVQGPGADQPVKDLATKIEAVLSTLRPPPLPPAPYEGPRGRR